MASSSTPSSSADPTLTLVDLLASTTLASARAARGSGSLTGPTSGETLEDTIVDTASVQEHQGELGTFLSTLDAVAGKGGSAEGETVSPLQVRINSVIKKDSDEESIDKKPKVQQFMSGRTKYNNGLVFLGL